MRSYTEFRGSVSNGVTGASERLLAAHTSGCMVLGFRVKTFPNAVQLLSKNQMTAREARQTIWRILGGSEKVYCEEQVILWFLRPEDRNLLFRTNNIIVVGRSCEENCLMQQYLRWLLRAQSSSALMSAYQTNSLLNKWMWLWYDSCSKRFLSLLLRQRWATMDS